MRPSCPAAARRSPLPRRGDPDDRDAVAIAFGAAVRKARGKRTLEQIAGDIPRMDPKYLGEIERGWHSPTIATAKRIAEALKVPVADLVADL